MFEETTPEDMTAQAILSRLVTHKDRLSIDNADAFSRMLSRIEAGMQQGVTRLQREWIEKEYAEHVAAFYDPSKKEPSLPRRPARREKQATTYWWELAENHPLNPPVRRNKCTSE
jgi:hypothetical protein